MNPWMKFYPSDWRADPALRMCSLAARGLWAEMMCIMHEAVPYGHLLVNGKPLDVKQLASLSGGGLRETVNAMAELESCGVFSKTADGVIYSRRMKRDQEKSERDRENGKQGGHPRIIRGTVPKEDRVRRFRRSDSPQKAQRIFDRSAGCCHWCQKPLDPENYHIDHVIAIRDGGGNEETNLVASCPDCNGARAVISDPTITQNETDHKAQKPEARDQNPDQKTDIGRSPKATRPADPDFEEFWKSYPRRKGANPKAPALARFQSAVKAGDDPQAIIAGARRCASEDRDKIGTEFIPQAVKWLKDRRWEDYLSQRVATSLPTITPASPSWNLWKSHFRDIGKDSQAAQMDRMAGEGKAFTVPSEWPPGYKAA